MSTRTMSLIVTGLALLVIAVLCGLGVSSVLNKQDPDGPATTPSGHFTAYTPTPDTTASPSEANPDDPSPSTSLTRRGGGGN